MSRSFSNRPNFPEEEEKLVAKWKANKTFEKSVEMRPASRAYSFYDGPPFATGLPHYGHIVASLMKDMVPRFWTMRGRRVERRWGWDCHGLPIENIVEADLNLKHKKDIETLGIAKFNEACESKVLMYAEEWKKTIARLGRWVDMESDYKTMDLSYMESLWWVFRTLWDHGMIYEGKKAMHICPRCETPLSNFEVTQGYKDVEDTSVIWKFPLVSDPKTSLVAWTTTPWSTPSTMGLAVGPKLTYVKVQVGDEFLIFAKERLEFVLKDAENYGVVEEMKGAKLVGLEYEHILPWYKDLPEVKNNPKVYKVYGERYVDVNEGTGIVTINGAYGEIDYQAAMKNGLPLMMDVDMGGKFTAAAGPYEGMYVKDAEKKLIADVTARGRVWRAELFHHSYPHCWRCETPLLNYTTSSWFVRVTKLKRELLKNNRKIRWVPEHMKQGRFGKWLEEAKDWAVSRSRYWGTPLPVWRNVDDAKDVLCVGSVEELKLLSGTRVTDLHKHIVDEITITKDGKTYKRIPEVLDCWFESGAMPYAQMHYPFENQEKFASSFPAEFIAEGQDQTRGWFYTLHVLATALTSGENPPVPVKRSTPAFKNVIVNGIVLAEDGKKMAKRLQNYPEPDLMFAKYGADSVRYYLATSPVMHAENLNFSEKGVADVFRRTVLTLWNVVSFYTLYDDGKKHKVPKDPSHVLDQWILAKLNQLISDITDGYTSYDLNKASRPIDEFVQELSTWYVRRSRERFKQEGSDRDHARATLGHVLLTLSKLMAPVMPFMAEMIYEAVGGKSESVHLENWPKAKKQSPNEQTILETMARTQDYVEAAHASRKEKGVKVRQPLLGLTIPNAVDDAYVQIIKEEVNVKGVTVDPKAPISLDLTMTPELEEEGLVREMIRSVNTLRKKAGLTLDDRIELVYSVASGDPQVFERHKDSILSATLATSLVPGRPETETYHSNVRHGATTAHVGFTILGGGDGPTGP
ncbi:MAG: isoleucine--tRNA ligase [Candidatus Kerfeldbacteria bacterium]|nr:isoleucine--tRNA ligase [Candidatus Kerfeldbacteria bacterium]